MKEHSTAPVDQFDERVAAGYDARESAMFAPEAIDPAVDFLTELAEGGPALELGVGTGRIALPLSERVRVHGIDLSPAMVALLREKPGAERIPVTVGDFASTAVPETFSLAYLVFNTIMNLTTQDEQVACFVNVANHLRPGGCFAVEVGIPRLRELPPGETLRMFTAEPGRIGFDEYETASQRLVSHHYVFAGERVESFSTPFRYVWPAELDLMARLAGLTLRERWSDWHRAPFTSDSVQHISVWQKP